MALQSPPETKNAAYLGTSQDPKARHFHFVLLAISVLHYRFNAWCIIFIFFFFGTSFGPIEYKGPMSAVYIEKFVRRVMKPLLYIPSQSELLDFLSNYEVPVFHISSHSQGFTGFYWIICIRKVVYTSWFAAIKRLHYR